MTSTFEFVVSMACMLLFNWQPKEPVPDQVTCSAGHIILHYPNVDFWFQTLDVIPCRPEKEKYELYELRRD